MRSEELRCETCVYKANVNVENLVIGMVCVHPCVEQNMGVVDVIVESWKADYDMCDAYEERIDY